MHGQRIPDVLLPHQVTVERYLRSGAYGDIYDDPEHITRAQVEDKVQWVRDSKGVEQVSNTTIYLEIPEQPINPGSLVTRWAGTAYEQTSKVIAVSVYHHPQGLSHVVLNLE